tara:strand:- start:4948 stop:5523 length:576 start_codon:yes stop_codon:yes gene_type:complete
MSRSIGSDFSSQLSAGINRPFYALSVAFKDSTLRLWTGIGDLFFDGNTFIGSGNLLSISNVNETADIRASGIKVSLSGLDSSILSSSISQDSEGGVVKLYFGVLKTEDNRTQVVDSPYQLFEGSLDTIQISETGESAMITVTVENKLIMLEIPRNRRYTDQDQKNLFAGDKGLEFVDDLQDKELIWGGGSR